MQLHSWFSRQSIRTKLLTVTVTTLLIIVGGGSVFLFHLARESLKTQIESDMRRSQELITSMVRRSSEATIRNYLRAIAEKNRDLAAYFYEQARQGKYTEAEAKRRAAEVLLAQKIGDTGYMVAVDTHGVIQVHPKAVGKNVSHLSFVQHHIRIKRGYIEYDWAEPGEKVTRPKALYGDYFEPWDWLVTACSYRSEFVKLINIKDLSDSILSVRFGRSGYSYILDRQGNMVVHPTLAGQNVVGWKDQSGRAFVREILEKKTGSTTYTINTPGDTRARERVVFYRDVPELGWTVATTVFADEAYAPLNRLRWAMLVTGLLTLLLSGASLYFVGRAITRPLGGLMDRINRMWHELRLGSHISQITGTEPIVTQDEVVILTKKFDTMAIGIRLRDRQLAEHRDNLEGLVQQRTVELSERNHDMRVVLDTIDQGLVTLCRNGTLGAERSATFDHWFAGAQAGTAFHTLLSFNATIEQTFQLAWEALLENVIPIEVNLELLPKRAVRGKQHFAFEYHPILDEQGDLTSMLLVVTDITAQVEGLMWEAEQREFLHVFERVLRDKAGFIEFFNEAAQLADELATHPPNDDSILRRKVHTLKGNAATFGLQSIAELCHSLETRAAEAGVVAMREALPLLVSRWGAFATRVAPLIGTDPPNSLEITLCDLAAIERLARGEAPHSEILRHVERLKFEPTRTRFRRIAEQVEALAQRLNKGRPVIEIKDNDVRLPLDRWSAFWGSFVHAVRNAVDHGLEPPHARGAKPAQGRIELSSNETASGYVLTITDDGRGIDWDSIRRKANDRGLPSATQEDLVEAMFTDGISTKFDASEVSGRGVGMGALRDQCRTLGGTIYIESKRNTGTTIHFEFPRQTQIPLGLNPVSGSLAI